MRGGVPLRVVGWLTLLALLGGCGPSGPPPGAFLETISVTRNEFIDIEDWRFVLHDVEMTRFVDDHGQVRERLAARMNISTNRPGETLHVTVHEGELFDVTPDIHMQVIQLKEGRWLGFHDSDSSSAWLGRCP